MPHGRGRWATTLRVVRGAFFIAGSLAVGSGTQAQKIPETHAQTLPGSSVNLPGDLHGPGGLHGKVAVLVLGFSKNSSAQCRAWDDRINPEFGGDPRVEYFQMPVLADVPGMIRSMVLHSMRRQLPPAAWTRFVPLLQDEIQWKELTSFTAEDDAYVLIVDDAGLVRWRTSGPVTPAAYADFRANVVAAEK